MPPAGTYSPDADHVCIGILLLVPEPLATRVREVRQEATPGWTADIPAHVTLVPPTILRRGDLPEVVDHLALVALRRPAFELRVRGTATFRPVTAVAYLRVAEGGESCTDLQDDLCNGPRRLELWYPYHPHVTLAHDVSEDALDRAQEAMDDVDERFTVSRFVLFVDSGDGWESAGEFELRGGVDHTQEDVAPRVDERVGR